MSAARLRRRDAGLTPRIESTDFQPFCAERLTHRAAPALLCSLVRPVRRFRRDRQS
jgi:hypothetical protein